MTCQRCGVAIASPRTGRPRRFCGDRCRQQAHRADLRDSSDRLAPSRKLITSLHVGRSGDLFADILKLHVKPGSRVVDPTYGQGVLWRKVAKTAYEVLATDLSTGVDLRKLPYRKGSVDALVLDPPFIEGLLRQEPSQRAGRGSHAYLQRQYGLQRPALLSEADNRAKNASGPRWYAAVLDLYRRGGKEAARVLKPGGVLIVKVMDQVSSGVNHPTHIEVANHYATLGLEFVDLFILGRKSVPRVSGDWQQKHARKSHSYFMVFRRE